MFKKKNIYIAVIILVVLPIIVNILVTTPGPVETDNDWIGFFGSYFGSILGGLIAFYVAWIQIEAHRKSESKKELESNRAYIIVQEFSADIRLKNITSNENSRLILNDYYEEIKEQFNKEISVTYYKIIIVGNAEAILDCDVYIKISNYNNPNETYEISSYIGIIAKGEEIFVPIANIKYQEVHINFIRIRYKTLKGEKIEYVIDYDKRKENYFIIEKNNQRKALFEDIELKVSNWEYPFKGRK